VAHSVRRVVVKVLRGQQAKGGGGWRWEELRKLVVDFFQFFDYLEELV